MPSVFRCVSKQHCRFFFVSFHKRKKRNQKTDTNFSSLYQDYEVSFRNTILNVIILDQAGNQVQMGSLYGANGILSQAGILANGQLGSNTFRQYTSTRITQSTRLTRIVELIRQGTGSSTGATFTPTPTVPVGDDISRSSATLDKLAISNNVPGTAFQPSGIPKDVNLRQFSSCIPDGLRARAAKQGQGVRRLLTHTSPLTFSSGQLLLYLPDSHKPCTNDFILECQFWIQRDYYLQVDSEQPDGSTDQRAGFGEPICQAGRSKPGQSRRHTWGVTPQNLEPQPQGTYAALERAKCRAQTTTPNLQAKPETQPDPNAWPKPESPSPRTDLSKLQETYCIQIKKMLHNVYYSCTEIDAKKKNSRTYLRNRIHLPGSRSWDENRKEKFFFRNKDGKSI
ncbi:hypothetical protein VP01_2598g3 [Puccinia sorghi]|uniref:Uncharacterized protein n=1 Tax=Puccinia sorghi TaxID=27349 RepID=A0A0L6V5B2_9BASI|nr:hypothetical protein VP01_2598g3 [Puccinia sorghi]